MATADQSQLLREYAAEPVSHEKLAPDYNVAPSKHVYAIMQRHEQRQLRVVSWGLIPSWAKDPKIGHRLANARLETASEKPSFRRAWAKRRAILPADGYYEWYTTSQVNSKGKPVKQPFYIHQEDGSLLSMAALYEIWRDPAIQDEEQAGAFRWTCTILTTSATDELGRIHDRMPLLVDQSAQAHWLDPEIAVPDPDALHPASPDTLDAYPVSTLVNRVANNSPELLRPLPATEALG